MLRTEIKCSSKYKLGREYHLVNSENETNKNAFIELSILGGFVLKNHFNSLSKLIVKNNFRF